MISASIKLGIGDKLTKVMVSTEQAVLLAIYETSFMDRVHEPHFDDILQYSSVTKDDLKITLRKLQLSGYLVGNRLTAQGKIQVENSNPEHPILVELNSIRQAFLTELIMKTQQEPHILYYPINEFELAARLPEFFFEFFLDVLEAKGFVRFNKLGRISIGPVLKSALQRS